MAYGVIAGAGDHALVEHTDTRDRYVYRFGKVISYWLVGPEDESTVPSYWQHFLETVFDTVDDMNVWWRYERVEALIPIAA